MWDVNGHEIAKDQTVKLRSFGDKAKVVRLDPPFVWVKRDNHYDDTCVDPQDLTVVDSHLVNVLLEVRAESDTDAKAIAENWMDDVKNTVPENISTYKVETK